MLFTGEYEHTIDAKQRMAIPAEIRARIDADRHGAAFYLVPGANGALWMWPERTFEQLVGAMDRSPLPREELMDFDEFVFTQAARLEPDSAGRVRLPERLLEFIGATRSVMVLGVRDHLELRDPADWAARRARSLAKADQIMLRARTAMESQRRKDARDAREAREE